MKATLTSGDGTRALTEAHAEANKASKPEVSE